MAFRLLRIPHFNTFTTTTTTTTTITTTTITTTTITTSNHFHPPNLKHNGTAGHPYIPPP
jgi:hypothetical protein